MQRVNVPIEDEVLNAAKNGDALAFERIVFIYEKRIYRYIVTMVGPIQAEDLTQETFLKLYRNIHRYNAKRSFNAWVYTIARTTVYDFLRKERKRKDQHIINDEQNYFEPIAQRNSEINSLDAAAMRIDTRKALRELPKKYKEVIMLYYWEGLTYDEIARTIGVSVNTVKTRLRRAKSRLKEILIRANTV